MTVRWHTESWRKLYTAKSPAWLRLPVSARGLGFLLLTYCDDNGEIDIGDDSAGVAVAYLLGARPKEHKRIAEDVEALIADTYLTLEGSKLSIRNFAEAQDRTPAAKRTAEWRARKDAGFKETAPSTGVTCDVTRMSPGDALVTSLVRRSCDDDPIRAEPSREDPPVVPQGGPAPVEGRRRRARAGEPKRDTRAPGVDATPDQVEAWLVEWNIPPVSDATWGTTVQDFLDRAAAKGSAYTQWGAAWKVSARKAVGWGHCHGDPKLCMRSDCAPLFSAGGQAGGYDRPPPPPNARLEAAKARLEADGWSPPPLPSSGDAGEALLALVSKGAA